MITPCILVRLEAKSGDPNGHVGSMLIKATNHHRAFPLATVTAGSFWIHPAARAQHVPTASGAPGAGSSGRE
jgi:hypothetical protein